MSLTASDFADIFTEEGQTLTLVHITPGAFDADTQEAAAATESEEAFIGIVRNYDQRLIDGRTVLVSDRTVLVDPSTVSSAPSGLDQIEIDSVRHQIVNVRTIDPSGDVLAYDCQIRGIA